MQKFNLVKSLTRVINTTTLPFREGLGLGRMLILCLSLATFGVNEAWGGYRYAKIYVYSEPTTGGYVYANTSNSGSVGTLTSDNASNSGWKTIGSMDFTFYLFAKAKSGYAFKGFSSTQTSNNGETSNPFSKTITAEVKNDISSNPATATYYAIFARMTADISSKDFGNVNVGQSSSATTITVTHAHASKITAALSGTNTSDFSLSTTTIVDNSVSEGTATFTVTFKPTCNGTRTATLTLSSSNGLNNVTISLSGTGVLNSQSLSWNNESSIELNMLNGTTQNISATATSGLTVSYSSSNSGVLSVDASGKLTAKSVGEATITASQSGDCTYSAATSISKTFNVKTKDTPIFTPNWSSTNIKVGDKVTLGVQYVSEGLNGNFKAAYNSTIFNVTREGNTITIEALNEGDASVAFTQTETSSIFSASKTYSFSVSKIANTLTTAETHTMKVDETWNNVYSNKNSDGTITTESTDASIAYFDVANNKIVAPNLSAKSFNSTEVEITISQAATYKYTAASKTIKVTVNKWDNHISINGSQDSYATSCYIEGYAQISSITATNTDYIGSPFSNIQKSGNDIATFYQNDMVVYSSYKLGTATWTISQPENYKYKAANATLTVNVVQQAEATDCYVATSAGTYWAKLGNTTDALTWTDQNAAKDLYFKATISTASVSNAIQVQQYVNGAWSDIGSKIDGMDNYPDGSKPVVTLSQAATGVRWWIAGSLGSDITNIKVTRATYLNASDVNITTTQSNNPIHPNEVGVGTLTINRSLANGGNLKVKWDNDKFTINNKTASQGIDLGDLGCSTGVSNLPISYISAEAGTHTANVVIYNNVYQATATIKGTTIKRDQEIQWNTTVIVLGQTQSKAAQTNSIVDRIVTYTSDNPEVICVNNDANGQPTILEALKEGSANITVFSAGNEEFNDAYDTKEITVTDKNVQSIVWDQSLMGLELGGGNVTLKAYATQPDSLNCLTGSQRSITYQSADESIVKVVNNNQLQIIGAGVTTVTATQAGGPDMDGHNYLAVSMEKKVVVRDPNAPCETYIYEQTSEVEFDLGWNEANKQTKTKEIDFGGQEPRYVNFDYKGKSRNVIFEYYDGSLCIDQYVNDAWQEVKNLGQPTKNGNYANTGDISLNRAATKMRVRVEKGLGYMYFKDCRVTLARYLESSALNTFETKVGSPVSQTLTVNYSNISGPISFTLEGSTNFTIDKNSLEGTCGDKGSTTIKITYTPTGATDNEQATLRISDENITKTIALKGKASLTPLHIVWDIPDTKECYTIDEFELSAKALTDLNVEIPNFVSLVLTQNTKNAVLSNNKLTFNKAGDAIVAASTISDYRYTPAQIVFKTWKVALAPTEVFVDPEVDSKIVYGAQLNDLRLKEGVGAARNTVNQHAVEGTFAITGGDISTAGQRTITVTFTPTNTDMYASCTKDITVTVLKANPDATPQAGNIIYGAAVNTSVLTNEGTTEGTWTWTDDKKEQVLEVGTHNNLAVHFTPTDQTNYNEKDGTVSLTIIKATPVFEWTAKAETAQVHEKKTFTASSTNTDNTAAITYSITEGGDCATIDASTGEVTMLKAGTITVRASQDATTNFNAATSTITCVVKVAPTTITTQPTVGDIVSGTAHNAIVLQGGAAQNTVNSQAVEGTFAVTDGDVVNVGQQTLTITFTPSETNKYASSTTTITATIIQRTPTAEEVGTPTAADIYYGQTIGESVLTGNGTLEGKWIWTDDQKEEKKEMGTYENLNVQFVPNDKNVKPVDAKVTLQVIKPIKLEFVGSNSDDWNDPLNWEPNMVPESPMAITVSKPLVIKTATSIAGVQVESNGKITITPTGGLTVAEKGLINENAENLIIQSSQEGQGYLRISPEYKGDMPLATVEFATKSTLDNGANNDAEWQYFGVAVGGVKFTADYITWLYDWDEKKGWVNMKDNKEHDLLPFHGYVITQYGQPTYSFQGSLLMRDTTITLTKSVGGMNGDNIFANSYSAPIDVRNFTEDDFEGDVEKVFYLFNSGSWNNWQAGQDKDNVRANSLDNTPGTYYAIPALSASYLDESYQTVIPPMSGVYVVANQDGAKIHLNYEKHVWNAESSNMNKPLRASQMINDADCLSHRVVLAVRSAHSGNDRISILEHQHDSHFTQDHDNGYDAAKLLTEGIVNIYTNELAGTMSISATNNTDSMFIGFNAGEDYNYELNISSVIGEGLELMDMQTYDRIEIKDGVTYAFDADPNSEDPYRFRIFKTNKTPDAPTGWDGLGDKAKIWYDKQTLYISDATAHSTASIYTAAGDLLKQVTFNYNTTISTEDMPEGVYTIRVEDSVLKFFVKY